MILRSSVMDHDNLPACAAIVKKPGTVIVRIKMEVDSCGCPEEHCISIVHRPLGCEQCCRNRLLFNNYSVCDSGLVRKCLPFKSSSSKCRRVAKRNVNAAVCFLLILCALSPCTSAAPYRSRTMDEPKQTAQEENYLWRNPCSYNDSSSKVIYQPKNAKFVAQQAKNVFQQTASYKDQFTRLHSFDTFDNLLKEWKEDWLRKFSWFREEVLPRNKILFQSLPDEDVADLMNRIDDVLPSMYKGLKMMVASLYQLSMSLASDGISSDEELALNIAQTMKDVRAVLCYFYDLMKARNLEVYPVYDFEIPVIDRTNKLEVGLYIYRDTLNYLEYLSQVFQKMSETNLPNAIGS